MVDENIAQLKVHVKRGKALWDDFMEKGASSDERYELRINTEWAWEKYQEYRQAAARIAESREEKGDTKKLKKLLYTRRLPDYLATAPVERSIEFAYRIGQVAIDRELSSNLLHEVKHQLDRNNRLQQLSSLALEYGLRIGGSTLLWVGSYAIVDVMPSSLECLRWLTSSFIWQLPAGLLNYYVVNPVERSAKKFASQHKNDPKWRAMMNIREK